MLSLSLSLPLPLLISPCLSVCLPISLASDMSSLKMGGCLAYFWSYNHRWVNTDTYDRTVPSPTRYFNKLHRYATWRKMALWQRPRDKGLPQCHARPRSPAMKWIGKGKTTNANFFYPSLNFFSGGHRRLDHLRLIFDRVNNGRRQKITNVTNGPTDGESLL